MRLKFSKEPLIEEHRMKAKSVTPHLPPWNGRLVEDVKQV